MSEQDPQTQLYGERPPVFGEQGEPCEECGSPLAADQRYCLNCGKRRGGPRVEYRQLIGDTGSEDPKAVGPAPPSASAPTPAEGRQERDYAPLAAVGGIAILGLMLLVGVLIGKGNDQSTPAPAPVVTVGDTGGAATADTRTGKSETTAAKPKETAKKKKKVKTGAQQVQGGLTGTAARNSDATVQASQDDLEALEGKSGESYEETVKKLPDKIATPGAPPPIDKSKPPGGGGGGETIE